MESESEGESSHEGTENRSDSQQQKDALAGNQTGQQYSGAGTEAGVRGGDPPVYQRTVRLDRKTCGKDETADGVGAAGGTADRDGNQEAGRAGCTGDSAESSILCAKGGSHLRQDYHTESALPVGQLQRQGKSEF